MCSLMAESAASRMEPGTAQVAERKNEFPAPCLPPCPHVWQSTKRPSTHPENKLRGPFFSTFGHGIGCHSCSSPQSTALLSHSPHHLVLPLLSNYFLHLTWLLFLLPQNLPGPHELEGHSSTCQSLHHSNLYKFTWQESMPLWRPSGTRGITELTDQKTQTRSRQAPGLSSFRSLCLHLPLCPLQQK